jgi:hypothetical protein
VQKMLERLQDCHGWIVGHQEVCLRTIELECWLCTNHDQTRKAQDTRALVHGRAEPIAQISKFRGKLSKSGLRSTAAVISIQNQ